MLFYHLNYPKKLRADEVGLEPTLFQYFHSEINSLQLQPYQLHIHLFLWAPSESNRYILPYERSPLPVKVEALNILYFKITLVMLL